jgi:dihydropteroate synthase
VIDIGGESTRPGAAPIPLDEELARTIPVIEKLAHQTDVPISIDTTKAEVARQALAAGAVIVNDISGLTFDPEMMSVCAEFQAAVCVMHIKGTPQAMQQNPVYEDVVQEVTEFLQTRLSACEQAGIDPARICIDPGIGFGKTAQHNLTLMQATARIRKELGRPILVGHSRKRFLSKLLGRPVEERNAGTVGVSVALAQNGADILRVHDVSATRDALTAWIAVRGTRS